jgi:hypothetical protein
MNQLIPVAARSKGWVCYRPLSGIAGSNTARGMDVCLVSVVYCQVEVPATGRSLVQRSPALCCVSLNAIRCNSNPVHLP